METPYDTMPSNANRILAYVIDALVAGAITMVPIVGWAVGLAYMVTRDALPFLDGQSVGKKVLKLRAVTNEGEPLTNNWNQGIIRNVVLIIPFFPLVELIVWLTNAEKKRLGDQWAKTKVIAVAE
jgi:uncharacterized RDD family membrane protein YckC